MIISFIWPSSHHYAGGVRVLWELANGLTRRGHEVHFIHGPLTPLRINHLDELPPFDFEPDVRHHIVDALDEPGLPEGDIVFHSDAPASLGLPVVMIQGFRMIPLKWERDAFRARAPKVCVARWLMDIGRSFGAPPEQLWHVPLGMDHDTFVQRTPLTDRTYDVAVLCNLHVQKGWDVGRATLHELLGRRPSLRPVVFGIYPPPEDLPPSVDLKVGLGHDRLATEVYNASKIYVQSSFHEGFGYASVEAMACGAALVTTDNGGSGDYALPDETALVVPTGDVAGLADSVERLLDDEVLRLRLSRAGERYVRRFDWDRSAAILDEHLRRYLADPDAFRRAPDDREEESEAG